MNYLLKFAVIIILLNTCNTYKTKYPYSLADFKPELRVHLEKIVENGGMCEDFTDRSAYTYLSKKASNKELEKLVICQHPLLRAYAFNVLCQKNNPSINKILYAHLDDTAIISYCAGEFGPSNTTVADYFLDQSRKHTSILTQTLVDTVITKHPYLIHAVTFLSRFVENDEKYYPPLKKIVENKYRWHYNYEEELLVLLSKYKKNSDTSSIAKELNRKWFRKEDKKFPLIEDNPVASYFYSIEKYYKKLLALYEKKYLQDEFIRDEKFARAFENFISATAAYRSKRSADILTDILNRKIYARSQNKDKNNYGDIYFRYILENAVKKHSSPYYKNLMALTLDAANYYKKNYTLPPMEAYIDTNKEKNTW